MKKRGRKTGEARREDLQTARSKGTLPLGLDHEDFDVIAGSVSEELASLYNDSRTRVDVSGYIPVRKPVWASEFSLTAYFMEWYATLGGCDGVRHQRADRDYKLMAIQQQRDTGTYVTLQAVWLAESVPPRLVVEALGWASRLPKAMVIAPFGESGLRKTLKGRYDELQIDWVCNELSSDNECFANAQESLLQVFEQADSIYRNRSKSKPGGFLKIIGCSRKTGQVAYAGPAEQMDYQAALLVSSTANIVGRYAWSILGRDQATSENDWDVLVTGRALEAIEKLRSLPDVPLPTVAPGTNRRVDQYFRTTIATYRKSLLEFRIGLSTRLGPRNAADFDGLVSFCSYLLLRRQAGGFVGPSGGVLRMCKRAQYSFDYLNLANVGLGSNLLNKCPEPFFVWRQSSGGKHRGQTRAKYCPICIKTGTSGTQRQKLRSARIHGQFLGLETGVTQILTSDLPGHGEPQVAFIHRLPGDSCPVILDQHLIRDETFAAVNAARYSRKLVALNSAQLAANELSSKGPNELRSPAPTDIAAP